MHISTKCFTIIICYTQNKKIRAPVVVLTLIIVD